MMRPPRSAPGRHLEGAHDDAGDHEQAALHQEDAAREHNVQLLVSTMSPTGAINVGAGCLFVAFASQDDEFE